MWRSHCANCNLIAWMTQSPLIWTPEFCTCQGNRPMIARFYLILQCAETNVIQSVVSISRRQDMKVFRCSLLRHSAVCTMNIRPVLRWTRMSSISRCLCETVQGYAVINLTCWSYVRSIRGYATSTTEAI